MKILTALGNQDFFDRLKKVDEFNLYKNDVLYREGILEILKKEKDFDIIIIYEKIPGEINFIKLINEIKIINYEIKIVFILENNNLENKLLKKNITSIFYNSEINFDDFILKIKQINYNDTKNLIKEIEKLKKIIQQKDIEIQNYKKIINNNKIKKQITENKKLTKVLIISEINFYQFTKIKKIIQNKENKIDYLNLYNLNRRIKNYNNIIFLINIKIEEIKKIIELINKTKENYLLDDKKIKIIFIENKDNLINIKILKKIFFNFDILGKIKNIENDYKINKNLIKKISNLKG